MLAYVIANRGAGVMAHSSGTSDLPGMELMEWAREISAFRRAFVDHARI
jgi:hypothetical protein